jgi:maleate isomerase
VSAAPDYGARGRFGLLTPQANPTVEPEFRRLMTEGTELYVARLTSRSADPRTRLIEYLEQLPRTLSQFDTLRLRAVAFACTGSSYLLGAEREAELVRAAAAVCGAPVETAALAILRALEQVGARRLYVVSPYPAWLRDAGVAYWRAAGLDVIGTADVPTEPVGGRPDTRGIYELQSANAAAALDGLDTRGADAVLLSGTGMPSLALLRARGTTRPTLLSSNLCLAWRLHGYVDGWQPRPGVPLLGL